MGSDDHMLVDDDNSGSATEEMLSEDEGEYESRSSTSESAFDTFTSLLPKNVTRFDSFSSSSSGIEFLQTTTQRSRSYVQDIPVFKEPFQPIRKHDFEDNGLTPPFPQSPPSESGVYLNTSPYRTPPKASRSSLSASCGNLYNTAEAERLKMNLSERFKTGGGVFIPKREKIRTRPEQTSNENAPPNPLTRPHSSLTNRSSLSRASTLPIFSPYPTTLLPTISTTDECQRISAETLVATMQNSFNSISRYIILDCRYDFEFEGGHIYNAVHCPPARCEEILRERFIDTPITEPIAIIFHCEFSSKRGPSAYKLLRKLDRQMNTYPELTYPEMYVLDGGYREFFYAYPQFCFPNGYIEMKDKSFKKQLQICESQRKKEKASKIYRFASYNSSSSSLRHSSNSIHI